MAAPATHPVQPERILVRGVNWLGDAVMTTPALVRLRQRFSQAIITLYTPQKLAELWQHHPAIDTLYVPPVSAGLFEVARELRAGHFDLALIFPNSARSALEPWLAGIPRRVGYARSWRRWLLTAAVPDRPSSQRMIKRSPAAVHALLEKDHTPAPHVSAGPEAHQLNEYLHLAGALGADPAPTPPLLRVTPGETRAAAEKFGISGSQLLLGLNPGAEYGPAKRWPVDRFASVAVALQRQTGCRWVIFGAKADVPLANSLVEAIEAQGRVNPGGTGSGQSPVNLAGATSLRELMALLSCCRVLVTNDTGPMHVAAALGTPVVVPFGSTSPDLTGPGLPGDSRHHLLRTHVPCSPCFLRECPVDFRCMHSITPAQVEQAVLEAFSSGASPQS